jgi:MATE family multidrug resistance protein
MTPVRRELGVLSRLAWPLIATQVSFMLTGVVDALLLGRLSVHALDAASLGNQWGWSVMSLAMGMVMGIDPLVSQAHGEGDGARTGLALQRGLVVALCLSVPMVAAFLVTEPVLRLLGQDAELARMAGRYNSIRALGVPFILGFTALRSWLAGRNVVAPAMWIALAMNVVNGVLGWALIFGRLGLPRLELVGAAWVANLVTIAQPLLLVAVVRAAELHQGAWRRWDRRSFEPVGLWQVAKLGSGVGLQMALEGSAWSLAAILAGWLGASALAGHIIVLNMIALWFMVPVGISIAASVRVGNLIGAQDLDGARRAGGLALALGAGVMLISGAVFALFRNQLPYLFTADVAVVELAAAILPIAAAFQIFDGTQVVAGGVLRGAGRTRAPALVNLVGYYALALPLAAWFGAESRGGLTGIWGCLLVGLVFVSSVLLAWIGRTARAPLAELRVAAR